MFVIGEKNLKKLSPKFNKNFKLVDESCARKQVPGTLEVCVVRMSDAISYLGRDYEDGIMANLNIPSIPESISKVLGEDNSKIIGSLVNDLVKNSEDKNYPLKSMPVPIMLISQA